MNAGETAASRNGTAPAVNPTRPKVLAERPAACRFVSTAGGAVLGRITAFLNDGLRDAQGRPVGGIGFFECVENYAVACALLDVAVGWLRDFGKVSRVWGPIQFDIWYGYRFKVAGFASLSFRHEPANPAFYPEFFRRYGFRTLASWTSLGLAASPAALGWVARWDARLPAGYSVAPVEIGEVAILHQLVSRTFRGLPAFTPPQYDEFARLFGSRYQDPHICLLVRDGEARPTAFALAYPDHHPRRAVFNLIGIDRPAQRDPLLAPALTARLLRACFARGYGDVVLALMRKPSRACGFIGQRLACARAEYALFELAPAKVAATGGGFR